MGIAKKGSRRIDVDGVSYRWRVSRWRQLSDWKPADLELLDPRWLERGRGFGLVDVADAGGYENRMVPLEIWRTKEREDDTG
jgi:hypothetical protein